MVEEQPDLAWSFQGKFDGPDKIRSQTAIQVQILEEVRVQAPSVLEELAGHCLDLYQKVPTHMDVLEAKGLLTANPGYRPSLTQEASLPDWVNAGSPWKWSAVLHGAKFNRHPGFPALREALSEWAQKWFKDEPEWLMNIALEVVHRWRSGYMPADARTWFYSDDFEWLDVPLVIPQTAFRFEHPGWSIFHSQESWKKDCIENFQKALNEYIRYMEELAVNSGYDSVSTLRSSWHVPAFVKYQVLDWSKQKIANHHPYHISPSTIDKALGKVAESAGIELRPSKRASRRQRRRASPPVRTGITAKLR